MNKKLREVKVLKGSSTKFTSMHVYLSAYRIHIDENENVRKRLASPEIQLDIQRATVKLPIETLMSWYCLYFYYDWIFDDRVGDFVLECLPHTPKATKAFIEKRKPFTLSRCVNYKGSEITANTDKQTNFIYRDNVSACADLVEFSHGTLTTFLSEDISEQAIKTNYTYLNAVAKNIRQGCYGKYLDYELHKDPKDRVQHRVMEPEQFDRILYQFATESDLRTLIKMGLGTRLTDVLNKAYKGHLVKE